MPAETRWCTELLDTGHRSPHGTGGRCFYFEACAVKENGDKGAGPTLGKESDWIGRTKPHRSRKGTGYGEGPTPTGRNREVGWMVSMTPWSLQRAKKIYGGLSEVSRKLLLEPACPLHPRGCIISLHPNKNLTTTFKLLHAWALWNSFLETLPKSPLSPATIVYSNVLVMSEYSNN